MNKWLKPYDQYLDVTMHDNVTITFAESRLVLERIGIPGEILPSPGHSDDSISLLLDDGSAFTGDLTHPAFIGLEEVATVHASWRLLQEPGATRIYPGHGPVRPMQAESII